MSQKCPCCEREMKVKSIYQIAREDGYMSVEDYNEKDWNVGRFICIKCHIIGGKSK